MGADGRGSTALTSDLDYNYGLPSWSPDGRQLLAQRFDIRQTNGDPGVWLVDVNDGALQEIAGAGFAPSWLP
jgi:Tol biopolymer transport system component